MGSRRARWRRPRAADWRTCAAGLPRSSVNCRLPGRAAELSIQPTTSARGAKATRCGVSAPSAASRRTAEALDVDTTSALRARYVLRATMTGIRAACTTAELTDPSSMPANPPRPWLSTTTSREPALIPQPADQLFQASGGHLDAHHSWTPAKYDWLSTQHKTFFGNPLPPTIGDMTEAKKNDPRGPNKAEPTTKAKPAQGAVPGANKKKK